MLSWRHQLDSSLVFSRLDKPSLVHFPKFLVAHSLQHAEFEVPVNGNHALQNNDHFPQELPSPALHYVWPSLSSMEMLICISPIWPLRNATCNWLPVDFSFLNPVVQWVLHPLCRAPIQSVFLQFNYTDAIKSALKPHWSQDKRHCQLSPFERVYRFTVAHNQFGQAWSALSISRLAVPNPSFIPHMPGNWFHGVSLHNFFQGWKFRISCLTTYQGAMYCKLSS